MQNIVRKGEIAYNKQFLLFSQCFPPYMPLYFQMHFKLTSGIWFNLDQSKILSSGNGLVNTIYGFFCLNLVSENQFVLIKSQTAHL